MKVNFYCVGSYIGLISGSQQVAFWPRDPLVHGFSHKLLVAVDLAKTPSAARAGLLPVDDIQCDDHRTNGGLTTIGPLFPGGAMIGACWLAEPFLNSLGASAPERTSPDDHDHELQMTMYFGGELGDRTFNGFHAQLVSTQGNLSLVDVWHGGTAKAGASPAGRWWLDLATVSDPNHTNLSPTNPIGPLFLDRQTQHTLALRGPKRPPAYGVDGFAE